ncbi:MAG: acyl-CoA dehydrogenase family protein [Elusimicrobia bacterium]|nr:acyl-CoA dehydrogenase family protein [Elusimicrobiota bacterium]
MPLSFELTDEQKLIRDSVRAFAEKEIRPLAHELDRAETFSPGLTKRMGAMGLFGMTVDPEYGGQGMDYVSYIIAVEELARVDGSQAATLAAHNSLGVGPIYYFGSEEQKKRYLPKLCSGDHVWAFALTEPEAGSDAGGTRTTAKKDGGQWKLNGSKVFITNASCSSSLGATVQAVTGAKPDGKKEYTCFLLEKGTPGYTPKTMKDKLLWRSSDTAELHFDNVALSDAQILGKQGEGFHQMLKTLDAGRLSIAAMGLGCAQGAYELGLKYAKQRRQFGKPISTFQANAFKLADMAMGIEHARLFLYKACWLKDQKRPYATESAMAKLYCAELARMCVTHSLQLHGAYGFMGEYQIERFFRDEKLLEVGEGTSEIQRLVISRSIGCYEP